MQAVIGCWDQSARIMWRFAIHVALQQALWANMIGTRFTGLKPNEFLSLLTSVHPRFAKAK